MEYVNIGLGSEAEPTSRVKIRGRTADQTMNALKIVDWNGTPIFTVRNDGLVCAKEILVQISGSPCWGDYVFDKDYSLMSLDDLEKFVMENKHLPNFPTAEEIEQRGLNIGEIQSLFVMKLEELTLYLIQLKKENEMLKRKIIEIEKKIGGEYGEN